MFSILTIVVVVGLAALVAGAIQSRGSAGGMAGGSPMKRAVIGFALFVVGLLGLIMTLCGGLFTFTILSDSNRGSQNYLGGAWALSVPSLLGGLGILWFVVRFTKKRRERFIVPPPDDPPIA